MCCGEYCRYTQVEHMDELELEELEEKIAKRKIEIRQDERERDKMMCNLQFQASKESQRTFNYLGKFLKGKYHVEYDIWNFYNAWICGGETVPQKGKCYITIYDLDDRTKEFMEEELKAIMTKDEMRSDMTFRRVYYIEALNHEAFKTRHAKLREQNV